MEDAGVSRYGFVITLIIGVPLLVLGLALGFALIAIRGEGGVRQSRPSTGQTNPTPALVADIPAVASTISETNRAPSLSVTPPPTQLVLPTVTRTAPAPTLPAPSPTVAPPPTVPIATPIPTVVPATATPSVSISIVSVPRAYVRDVPSDDASIIGGVEIGDELVVLGSRDMWYLVRVNRPDSPRSRIEGSQGWISQDQVSPPSQPVPEIAR